MSDEELDDLFRKNIDDFDPPYDPDAWTAMDKKLTQVSSGTSGWKKYFTPLLLLFLLGSVITLLWYNAGNETTTQAGKRLADKEVKPAKENGRVNRSVHTDEIKPTGTVPIKEFQKENSHSTAPVQSSALSETYSFQDIKSTLIPTEPLEDIVDVQGNVSLPATSTSTTRNNEFEILNFKTETLKLTGTDTTQSFITSSQTPYSESQLINDTAIQGKADSIPESEVDGPAEKKQQTFLRSIKLSLVVAPDVTTVKFKDAATISANAGILICLPLSEKFDLVTGVIWADKRYAASYYDYTPTSDYWTGKKKPSSIDASCSVLDIPLNIKYKLYSSGKNELSIQAGFSSYIMLKENYTYHYTYGYYPYSKTIDFRNQNRHLFGIQNVAVNYSRKLSPALSVGIEPFVKLPLSGIGAGQIKLKSAGVFLTAGYTVPLKR